MKARAAVVLIHNSRIALIERRRAGRHYFVFPGGKVEADETAEVAAKRETLEELGLEVSIGRMVAEIWYQGTPQYYFLAELIKGTFGKGTGKEMASLESSVKGSYQPVWMPLEEIADQPVLPSLMARLVSEYSHSGWPEKLVVVTENPPD